MKQLATASLETIRQGLLQTDAQESNFVKVELYFFSAISEARALGNETLLTALKQVQSQQYAHALTLTRKSSQRELNIKKFKRTLVHLLATHG